VALFRTATTRLARRLIAANPEFLSRETLDLIDELAALARREDHAAILDFC
jgi:hypothetical protein